MQNSDDIDDFEKKFDSLREQSPFTTPDKYFEKLNLEIQQQLAVKTTNVHTSFFFKHRILIPFAIGTLGIIIIAIILILPQIKTTKNSEKSLSEINIPLSDDDILSHVDENTLVEFITEQKEDTIRPVHKKKSYDLNGTKNNIYIDSSAAPTITDEDIMEYLIEEYGDDALKNGNNNN